MTFAMDHVDFPYKADGWKWACCGGCCNDTHTASCPVLMRDEPFVLGMLLGMRRELDAWPETWEHRCFSRMYMGRLTRCTCGKYPSVDWRAWMSGAELQFSLLFTYIGGDVFESTGPWRARPGTTIEVRR